jgi:hypothetical protein
MFGPLSLESARREVAAKVFDVMISRDDKFTVIIISFPEQSRRHITAGLLVRPATA